MTFTSVTLSVIKDLMYTNYRSSEKEPFQYQFIYPYVKKKVGKKKRHKYGI